jgi:hypothetical protein
MLDCMIHPDQKTKETKTIKVRIILIGHVQMLSVHTYHNN